MGKDYTPLERKTQREIAAVVAMAIDQDRT
jgi:hypothetical protein